MAIKRPLAGLTRGIKTTAIVPTTVTALATLGGAMPAWLIAALAALGVGGAILPALERATGIDIPFIGAQLDGAKPRRRRRRALTASDRADIGFIVGLLGPGAGKTFAITIASRRF